MSEYKGRILLFSTVAFVIAVVATTSIYYIPPNAASTTTNTANFCSNPCTILIQNSMFGNGEPVHVAVGTLVTWINLDATQHTVTSNSAIFDSPNLNPGQSYSFRFDRSGNYSYHDMIHPAGAWIVVSGTIPGGVQTMGFIYNYYVYYNSTTGAINSVQQCNPNTAGGTCPNDILYPGMSVLNITGTSYAEELITTRQLNCYNINVTTHQISNDCNGVSTFITSSVNETVSACSNPCVIDIENDVYGTGQFNVSVAVGTTVVWIAGDDGGYTVTSQCNVFHSSILSAGQNFTYTFTKPGAYLYFDEIHPGSGQILVGGSSVENACSAVSQNANGNTG